MELPVSETLIRETGNPVHCLVVEDDWTSKTLMAKQLSSLNRAIQVDLASTYEEAAEILSRRYYDFVLCDVMLPNGKSGVDLWRKVSNSRNTPFIMTSGIRREQYLTEFETSEAVPHFLPKPISLNDLKNEIFTAKEKLGSIHIEYSLMTQLWIAAGIMTLSVVVILELVSTKSIFIEALQPLIHQLLLLPPIQ